MKSILASIRQNLPVVATIANLKACATYYGIKLTKVKLKKADIINEIKRADQL